MGCFPWWSWLKSIWDREPPVVHEHSVSNERAPLIPIDTASSTDNRVAHRRNTTEGLLQPPQHRHARTSTRTIPSTSALPTDVPTDVSQSSIRDLVYSQHHHVAPARYLGPDTTYTGVQFPEEPEDAASVLLEEDVNHRSLEAELWDARLEWPPARNRYYIPDNKLGDLLTIDAIARELQLYQPSSPPPEIWNLSRTIFNHAPRLFATLVCLGLGDRIVDFLQEGLNDDDLPLVRAENRITPSTASTFELHSCRNSNTKINCIRKWTILHTMSLYNHQWWMLAPTFQKYPKVRHLPLEDDCVLPFIEDHEFDQATESGFSWVWPVRVHPAHQTFYETHNPLLALKKLHSTNKQEFLLEADMLKAFSTHRHPHLVKLLWTFELQRRYYLVFPYAKLNLRKYWEASTPEFTFEKLIWSLRQCKCIASGLMAIHNYRTTIQVNSDEPERQPPRDNTSPGVMPVGDERIYGRHGDIKPENILWTDLDTTDEDGNLDDQGLLLIADFGLMEFHGKLTRSLVKPQGLRFSPTYEPPERRLNVAISRAYDIWSLACVYLEFITWLVAGSDFLSLFPEARAEPNFSGVSYLADNDDIFYSIIPGNPDRAIVCQSVIEWILDLHESPRCSDFIHEFLDLVQDKMLVVDPTKRIPVGPLTTRLRMMLSNAETNRDYLINPTPRPPRERNEAATQMTQRMEAKQGRSVPTSPIDVIRWNRSERSTAANFGSPPSTNPMLRRPFSRQPA